MRTKAERQILKNFGNNLKMNRKSRGLSLRQLAALADLTHDSIDRYERGKVNPSITQVYRLADALGIDPGGLLPKNS